MMLYLSAVRHKDPNQFVAHAFKTLSTNNDALWKWVAGCRFADGEEVANALNTHFNLNELELSAKVHYYKECEVDSPGSWDSEEEEALLNQEIEEQGAFLLGPTPTTLPCKKAEFTEDIIKKNEQDNQLLFNDIEEILKGTNCSVILAITNKVFAGHWIVVDYLNIADNIATISDPNTAEAYRITLEELGENLPIDDGRVSLISIQTNKQSLASTTLTI